MAVLRQRPVGTDEFARQVDRFARKARGLTRRVLQRGAKRFKNRMQTEQLSGRPGINRISGETARSLRTKLDTLVTTLRLEAKIGNRRTPGVRVQEHGATIRPKSKPFLAIPLGPTGSGRRRGKVDFWKKNRKGNIVGFQKAENQIEPVVVLVDRVKIPARLQFVKTWRQETKRMIREMRNEYQQLAATKGK